MDDLQHHYPNTNQNQNESWTSILSKDGGSESTHKNDIVYNNGNFQSTLKQMHTSPSSIASSKESPCSVDGDNNNNDEEKDNNNNKNDNDGNNINNLQSLTPALTATSSSTSSLLPLNDKLFHLLSSVLTKNNNNNDNSNNSDDKESCQDASNKDNKNEERKGGKKRKSRMKCTYPGCTHLRRSYGVCITHGGGTRCAWPDCTKGAKCPGKYCVAHGGGRRCKHDGCTKSAIHPSWLCFAHGGGRRCCFPNCSRTQMSIQHPGYCTIHNPDSKCAADDCTNAASQGRKYCLLHVEDRCKNEGCSEMVARPFLFCYMHAPTSAFCEYSGCARATDNVQRYCDDHLSMAQQIQQQQEEEEEQEERVSLGNQITIAKEPPQSRSFNEMKAEAITPRIQNETAQPLTKRSNNKKTRVSYDGEMLLSRQRCNADNKEDKEEADDDQHHHVAEEVDFQRLSKRRASRHCSTFSSPPIMEGGAVFDGKNLDTGRIPSNDFTTFIQSGNINLPSSGRIPFIQHSSGCGLSSSVTYQQKIPQNPLPPLRPFNFPLLQQQQQQQPLPQMPLQQQLQLQPHQHQPHCQLHQHHQQHQLKPNSFDMSYNQLASTLPHSNNNNNNTFQHCMVHGRQNNASQSLTNNYSNYFQPSANQQNPLLSPYSMMGSSNSFQNQSVTNISPSFQRPYSDTVGHNKKMSSSDNMANGMARPQEPYHYQHL